MKLKSSKSRVEGTCFTSKCKEPACAIADGKTFFSKRGNPTHLCEPHLLEALEMSETSGLGPLKWVEVPGGDSDDPAGSLTDARIYAADVKKADAEQGPAAREPFELITFDKLDAQLTEEESEARDAVEAFGSMTIESKEDLTFAAEMLQEVKGHTKRLTDKRTTVTKPLNDALKATRALFKPALDFYGECERIIKRKMSDAHREAQAAARLALAEASVAAQDKDIAAVDEAIEKHEAANSFPEADGIQYRSVWKYEITDASQIPREFLSPDLKLIGAHVTHRKGAAVIPGVRVYEDTIIAAKSA